MLKRIFLFTLLLTLILFPSCDEDLITGNDNKDPEDTTETETETETETLKPLLPLTNDVYYGRSQLNDTEKKVYDLILKNTFSDFTDNITLQYHDPEDLSQGIYAGYLLIDLASNNIKGIADSETIKKIAQFAFDDEQRLFLMKATPRGRLPDEGSQYSYYTDAEGHITKFYMQIDYDEYTTYSNYAKIIEEIDTNIDTMTKDIVNNTSLTDFKQIARLYEAYLASVQYSQSSYGSRANLLGAFSNEEKDPATNNGKVLCEGYSRGFVYILQRLEFPAIYITGKVSTGSNPNTDSAGLHAWLKVKVENKWYNIDPTWDDSSNPSSKESYKNYFLQSDGDFSALHTAVNLDNLNNSVSYKKYAVDMPATPFTSVGSEMYQ